MQLRVARPADAEPILDIYNEAVLRSTATFDLVPRTEDEQARWMAEHRGPHPAIVATVDATTVGFAALSPYRDKHAYATTVENSVYVHVDYRGQGIGRALLEELVRLAGRHGFHSIIARIGENNTASIGLHTACGFELVGVEREVGRKFNRWLDVSVLQRLV
ncbi:MAG: N-acetyltransferase family protein [Acidimicrobiales bacterium]